MGNSQKIRKDEVKISEFIKIWGSIFWEWFCEREVKRKLTGREPRSLEREKDLSEKRGGRTKKACFNK